MDLRANIGQLKTPNDIARLTSILSEIADQLDTLNTDTAPNGNISARKGRIALYNNSGTYETWQNVDGATTWQRIDQGAIDTDSVKDSIFPVGSVYISTVSTNPATLLGFGTWVAESEGYAIVGYKSGDSDFGTAGDTVGEKTVTLTAAQSGLPAHSHTFTSYAYPDSGATLGEPTASNCMSTRSTNANAAANASESHTNIQPSKVFYIWRRTA